MLSRARRLANWRAVSVVVAVIVILVACAEIASPKPQTASTSSPTPSASPTASSTPTPEPTPTPAPTPNPFANRRVTLLVLGSDSTPTRLRSGLGRLTDSIIVVSVNKTHTQVSMLAFPRDIVDIPLGNGGVWGSKINSISYFLGEEAMKRAISATIRQPIDYYVEINMGDFSHLVDALGTVDVVVPRKLIDASLYFNIGPGLHHMSGAVALKYARSRHTTSDWDRAARQQQLVAAIVRKMVNPNTKINFLELLASLKSLRTDLPLNRFAALFELARKSAKARVVTKVMAPPQFSLFTGLDGARGYVEEPNISAIRRYAALVMGG
jgi:LCP family protein required for cell wall assembly